MKTFKMTDKLRQIEAGVALLLASFAATAAVPAIDVSNDAGLRAALGKLEPGATVRIAPGKYRGGVSLRSVSGTENARIVIRAADPKRRPVFEGGTTAVHLSGCSFVTLSDLVARGFPGNGVNVDDGGSVDAQARGVRLLNLRILDTGPRGNHDGLKMSGVDGFVVRGCVIEGWGGSGIDMVGCHEGVVEGCVFRGKEGFSQSNGVQMKGGSRGIVVKNNRFEDAGQRGVNIGGSTGLPYFRPKNARYEADRIEVANNQFTGGMTPFAFVNADRSVFRDNLVHLPEKWVCRILQESRGDRFPACRGGLIEHNLFVFDRRVRVFVNVGEGTASGSFQFRRNAWFDREGDRRPKLPVAETDGVFQADPVLKKEAGVLRVTSGDPALREIGVSFRE